MDFNTSFLLYKLQTAYNGNLNYLKIPVLCVTWLHKRFYSRQYQQNRQEISCWWIELLTKLTANEDKTNIPFAVLCWIHSYRLYVVIMSIKRIQLSVSFFFLNVLYVSWHYWLMKPLMHVCVDHLQRVQAVELIHEKTKGCVTPIHSNRVEVVNRTN